MPDNQENNRNPDGTFRQGFSGNLTGRPKGKSLKEYTREYFSKLTEEEKHEFLMGLSKDVIWKMAEGNPDTKTEHSGNLTISVEPELADKFNLKDNASNVAKDSTEGQPPI